MDDFKKYKNEAKTKYKIRTVSIRSDQDDFIKKQDINFSRYIRDLLDKIMNDLKNPKK